MTRAQIESTRADADMVTTPQAEQQVQHGRDTADAQNERMQRAYQEWIRSDVGEAAQSAARLPFSELESEAEYAAMLDWLSIRGPIE